MKDVKTRALPIRPASKTKNVRQASRSLQQGKIMIVAGFADLGSSQVFWLLKEIYTNGNLMKIYNDANKSPKSIAVSNSSQAIDWLEAIFPDLTEHGTRGDNKVVVKAHPYALLDASLALQATGRDAALKTPYGHTVLSTCQEVSDVSSLLDKTTPSQRGVQAAKPTRQKTPHNKIKLLPTSSFKTTATVVIAGVFSVVAAVSLTVPSVSHFAASCIPIIYDNTIFLLKPPYLYLVINCIILSIVATSKLTHESCSSTDDPDTVVPVPTYIDAGYLNVAHVAGSDYTGFVENDATVKDVHEVIDNDKVIGEDVKTETEKPRTSNGLPEPETDKPKLKDGSLEISVLKNTRKPPRCGRQKSLKASQEGKKSGLGVTKPTRRQDTLEMTWKKITEGRSTPLIKHLSKSDKWQERSHARSSKEKTTKSENSTEEETLQKTRLKREPSPGQEELNRRVEAFIKKFNEEMRLERLESLAKYNELVVNRGTRL
ncbi:unnamed protein product [Brassica oleracea]|uniref:DUF4408 domain-containing protein n=1 Tax=Brassica oleracea TaxID=3712 RepID=A0A3P6AF77_BRAOL|nr:unnamed protein product [Brassica oleracea]